MAFVQLNNEMLICSVVNYVVLDTIKQGFNLTISNFIYIFQPVSVISLLHVLRRPSGQFRCDGRVHAAPGASAGSS